jgi:hypothetical protein
MWFGKKKTAAEQNIVDQKKLLKSKDFDEYIKMKQQLLRLKLEHEQLKQLIEMKENVLWPLQPPPEPKPPSGPLFQERNNPPPPAPGMFGQGKPFNTKK